MKKLFIALFMLLAGNAYAADQEIRTFYAENGTKVARDQELFVVPEGKTFVLTTIYAFALNASSIYLKRDNETILRFHPANDNLLNFQTGLAFPSGSSVRANFRSNYLTLSGYLE